MKSFRRIALVLGGVTVGCGTLFAVATGCSSNGSETPLPDGGRDVTVDSPADTTGIDTTGDSSGDVVDSGSDGDAGTFPDVIVTVDSGDASALFAFPGQVAAALCAKLAQCCAVLEDGGFDQNRCTAGTLPYGWNDSSFGSNLLDGGNIVLNLGQAQACLQDIANIDCNANVVTSAESVALYSDCYGAMQGTAAAGAPCSGSLECAPTLFCGLPNDGGPVGSCVPLKTAGQPCGDYGAQQTVPTTPGQELALSECSYRGSGNTGVSCEIYALDSGATMDPSQWVCFQAGGAGAGCSFDVDCTSKRCDPNNFDCVSAVTFAEQPACAYYAPVADAGSD